MRARLLLRVIAKTVDFLIIAVATKTVPHIGFLAGLVSLSISDGLF